MMHAEKGVGRIKGAGLTLRLHTRWPLDLAGGSGGWASFQPLPHWPTLEHGAKPQGKGKDACERLAGSIILPM